MNHSSHIKTNSLAAAQVRCYRGVSGSLFGGSNGLQIQPTELDSAQNLGSYSKGMPAMETELSENKLVSRIT
ncbi:hypothetical protein AAFN60_00835 [Roseibacillus persicicus]|uniref:Uncharacterized protein n=1 Tax=Roseibacillus persicicus TaxID=454148 RepID=A0A918TGG5_9BACT|nr:hypothetical protein [Roseibacillus persicicus]GHC45711.1 hypothetical protein GCM10007100_08890 [Roseibacillus persicicus]